MTRVLDFIYVSTIQPLFLLSSLDPSSTDTFCMDGRTSGTWRWMYTNKFRYYVRNLDFRSKMFSFMYKMYITVIYTYNIIFGDTYATLADNLVLYASTIVWLPSICCLKNIWWVRNGARADHGNQLLYSNMIMNKNIEPVPILKIN